MDKLSVIIPARNESENLCNCISEIVLELNKNKISYEILVIDDGSTDKTVELLSEITAQNSCVRFLAANTVCTHLAGILERFMKVHGSVNHTFISSSSDPIKLMMYTSAKLHYVFLMLQLWYIVLNVKAGCLSITCMSW